MTVVRRDPMRILNTKGEDSKSGCLIDSDESDKGKQEAYRESAEEKRDSVAVKTKARQQRGEFLKKSK